jgi:hypothetical protein
MTEEAAGYQAWADRHTVTTGASGGLVYAELDRRQMAFPAALKPSGLVLEDLAARVAVLESDLAALRDEVRCSVCRRACTAAEAAEWERMKGR